MIFDPVIPGQVVWTIGIAAVTGTIIGYHLASGRLGWKKSAYLTICRLVAVMGLLLLLLQPSREVSLQKSSRNRVLLVGLDSSRSMNQADVGGSSRFDAAKAAIQEANFEIGGEAPMTVQFFTFDKVARPVAGKDGMLRSRAEGGDTLIHSAVTSMVESNAGEGTNGAVILLTDGHDFGQVLPGKTAYLARTQKFPVYVLPFGNTGKVRDIGVEITSFQPYSYVDQKATIAANLRLTGCEYEDMEVQLLKGDKILQSRRINADEFRDLAVSFEVKEKNTGQHEYEVRAVPIRGEAQTANNSAVAFLNVIEEQLHVLLLEGSPNWETSFLQRALMQNDKFDVDILVQYAPDRVRRIRKDPKAGELKAPAVVDDFLIYDVVILGRELDKLMSRELQAALQEYVRKHGGTVIFSNSSGVPPAMAELFDMQPVEWAVDGHSPVRLDTTADGRKVSPFDLLKADKRVFEALPEISVAREAVKIKPLASVFATGTDPDTNGAFPGFVHRRYGRGQVLALGLEGFWRIGFHDKLDPSNRLYDRFWDQMLIWLAAGADFNPSQVYSFRAGSPNVLMGEAVQLQFQTRDPKMAPEKIGVQIRSEKNLVAELSLVPGPDRDRTRLSASFVPEKAGRFEAEVRPPNSPPQKVKFLVSLTQNEDTDSAADLPYLQTLAEASGGRVIKPAELNDVVRQIAAPEDVRQARSRLEPIWDQSWVFYIIGLFLAADWFFRRKWGLC